jgi:hypothetical protein
MLYCRKPVWKFITLRKNREQRTERSRTNASKPNSHRRPLLVFMRRSSDFNPFRQSLSGVFGKGVLLCC